VLPFSLDEYRERLDKTRAEMSDRGLDALILTRAPNIFYLCGYRAATANWTSPFLALVVPAEGELRLITRRIERATAAAQVAGDAVTYRDDESAHALVADALADCGTASGRVGIEESFLSVSNFKALAQALPRSQLLDASLLIERIRLPLSAEEVRCFRRAAEITDIGFARAIEAMRPGVRAYDAVAEIHGAMYHGGQSDIDVPRLWIWSGPEGGHLHDTDVSRTFEDGEYATVEIWGTDTQYLAAAQGTVYFGDRPPGHLVETQQLLAEMYLAAKDAVKPGVLSGNVYDAANTVYRSRKGSDYWRRVGSNMGLTFGPMDLGAGGNDVISPWTPLILQFVEIDPGLVTCCSTLLVTDRGAEELTRPLLQLQCTTT
jgi:Xaa-Pro dipeptidase